MRATTPLSARLQLQPLVVRGAVAEQGEGQHDLTHVVVAREAVVVEDDHWLGLALELGLGLGLGFRVGVRVRV